MGLWGVLWEILKAVGPHAAPHVARAVTARRFGDAADRRARAVAEKMAEGFSTIEERLAAAEEKAASAERNSAAAEDRAAAAEEKLALAQAQFADQWVAARKWMLALVVWSALITAVLIYVIIVVVRH